IKLLERKNVPEQTRRAAVTALVAINPKDQVATLGRLLAETTEAPGLREHVAGALAGLNQQESRAELLKVLPTAPARLQSAIAAGLAGSPQGAEALLDAVKAGKASARLLLEKPVELRLNQSKLPDLKDRVAKLTAGLPAVDQKVQEAMNKRRDGFGKA